MLQQVCEYIHNYFIKEQHENAYEIADGRISPLDFLKEGQRFLITGSDLNDGMYTYHTDLICNDDDSAEAELSDEEFTGSVSSLAVPPSVIELVKEIGSWVEKYADVIDSPYQSENIIGVYSYTKAETTDNSGDKTTVGWKQVFNDRLNRWRRIAF